MATISGTPRPAYIYDAANNQWVPVGFGPHTHTDLVSTGGGSTITVASGSTVPLTITNDGTNNSLVINDVTGDASPVVVDPDGKVVIGASTPTQRLSLHSADFGIQINRYNTATTGAGGISFRASRNATIGSHTAVANNDWLGRVNSSGSDGSAFVDDVSEIRFVVDGTVSTGVVPTRTEFYTTSSAGTKAERMRIDAGGRLAIGDINNGYINYGAKLSVMSSPGTQASIFVWQSGVGSGQIGIPVSSSNLRIVNTYADGTITNGKGVDIDTNGNVGIGIASPTAKLHISAQASDGGAGAFIPVKITNTGTTATFNWALSSMATNMTNGQGVYMWMGQSESTLNAGGIGYRFVSSGSSSNAITFSHYASNNLVSINGTGELLVGYTTTNNTAYKLQVNSQIFATSSTIATSDARYKENVTTLEGGLAAIKALRPVEFNWKPQEDVVVDEKVVREAHSFPEGKTIGFIAQEVQEALADKPWINNLVKENSREVILDADGNEVAPQEDFLGIAEGNLIAVLVSAVKELTAKVEELEARLNQ